eukprot:TRINITY_DN20944_c1_g1_i1.p1 TRINITY_DN20944_c1_g1~~TRINITY_DN20944_c1_g1_i1.p1  ORF type:complete len:778 (+),score=136.62 TRINITY_DN20944_c1_g1_i1:243-2576(+)
MSAAACRWSPTSARRAGSERSSRKGRGGNGAPTRRSSSNHGASCDSRTLSSAWSPRALADVSRTSVELPRLWPHGRDGLDSRESLSSSATPRVLDREVVKDLLDSSAKAFKRYSNGNSYVGSMQNGLMHGRGLYTWRDGSTYDGEFRNGKMAGSGVRDWLGGQRYVGQWREDMMSGEGLLTLPTGETYEGQFLEGAYHGRGNRVMVSGDRFSGEFRNGMQEGEGTAISADGGWVFTGLYLHGRMYGPGRVEWSDGSSYVGEWRDGIREGQGRLVCPDGSWCEGPFKRNNLDGWGRQVFADGSGYVGEFRSGEMEGNGTFRWPDGTEIEGRFSGPQFHGEVCQRLASGVEITGCFNENGAVGPGKKRWPNGCSFEGNLLNSCIDKHGTLRWPDGRSYQGCFENGAMSGEGELEWQSNGGICTYKGEFRNNVFEGHGLLKWAGGAQYEGEFCAGKYHGEGAFAWPGHFAFYRGSWADGTMCGQGVLTVHPEGENEPRSYSYIGEFERGHMEGQGQVSFIPRAGTGLDEYKGAFKASRFTGLGMFTWRCGATLAGIFEDNYCNRVGRKKYPDGHEYTGGLRFDMEHGKGVVTDGGRCTMGIWENGKMVEKLVASEDLDLEELVVSGGRYSCGIMDTLSKSGRNSTLLQTPRSPRMLADPQLYPVHDADGKLVDGKAIVDFLSGDRYLGYMRAGRKQGFGVFVYSDMVAYKGHWEDDRLDGVRHPVTEGSPPVGVRVLRCGEVSARSELHERQEHRRGLFSPNGSYNGSFNGCSANEIIQE